MSFLFPTIVISLFFLGRSIGLSPTSTTITDHSFLVEENATFRVEADNTPMVNFVNRRLTTHLENIGHAWRVSKCL